MRNIFEEVSVQSAPNGAPLVVRWGARTLRALGVLEEWRAGGRWWLGEAPRDYYLVSFTSGLTAEVYREDDTTRLPGFEPHAARWVLARIVD